MPLFSPGLLKRTELLSLWAQRTGGSPLLAAARKKLPGGGTEVTGHRDYSPGDDFQAIDWALYARRSELCVKLFERPVRPRRASAAGLFAQHGAGPSGQVPVGAADRRRPGLREPDESRSAGRGRLCRRAGRRSAAAAASFADLAAAAVSRSTVAAGQEDRSAACRRDVRAAAAALRTGRGHQRPVRRRRLSARASICCGSTATNRGWSI